jgi:phosphoesterase RecJ-like protein
MNPPGVILKLNDTVTKANVPKTDVVVIVDTSAWQQLGNMADVIQASPAKRVVIDHHVSSDEMGAIELKDVTAAATGELICEAAAAFGIEFDEDTANWLYAAIATDTGWFRFPSTTSRTMRISAALIDRGASPHYVFNLVHEQSSLSRVQVDAKDMSETGAVPSDTEGLVNQCLTVAGSEAAFIAVELQTSQIKFSLRCRYPHDVASLAEQFSGGGHKLASGATLSGPLNVAVERMRTAFLEMLKKNEAVVETTG